MHVDCICCIFADVIYAVNGEQTYAETSKVSGFTINYSTGALIESWGPGTQVCILV